MVRLEILGGAKAGSRFTASRFPIRVGRPPEADLALEDPGVWAHHFAISRQRDDLILQAGPDALVTLNGDAVKEAPLRNGDVICAGAVKIQFAFSPMRQSSPALAETLAWLALAGLCGGQIALIYHLSQL